MFKSISSMFANPPDKNEIVTDRVMEEKSVNHQNQRIKSVAIGTCLLGLPTSIYAYQAFTSTSSQNSQPENLNHPLTEIPNSFPSIQNEDQTPNCPTTYPSLPTTQIIPKEIHHWELKDVANYSLMTLCVSILIYKIAKWLVPSKVDIVKKEASPLLKKVSDDIEKALVSQLLNKEKEERIKIVEKVASHHPSGWESPILVKAASLGLIKENTAQDLRDFFQPLSKPEAKCIAEAILNTKNFSFILSNLKKHLTPFKNEEKASSETSSQLERMIRTIGNFNSEDKINSALNDAYTLASLQEDIEPSDQQLTVFCNLFVLFSLGHSWKASYAVEDDIPMQVAFLSEFFSKIKKSWQSHLCEKIPSVKEINAFDLIRHLNQLSPDIPTDKAHSIYATICEIISLCPDQESINIIIEIFKKFIKTSLETSSDSIKYTLTDHLKHTRLNIHEVLARISPFLDIEWNDFRSVIGIAIYLEPFKAQNLIQFVSTTDAPWKSVFNIFSGLTADKRTIDDLKKIVELFNIVKEDKKGGEKISQGIGALDLSENPDIIETINRLPQETKTRVLDFLYSIKDGTRGSSGIITVDYIKKVLTPLARLSDDKFALLQECLKKNNQQLGYERKSYYQLAASLLNYATIDDFRPSWEKSLFSLDESLLNEQLLNDLVPFCVLENLSETAKTLSTISKNHPEQLKFLSVLSSLIAKKGTGLFLYTDCAISEFIQLLTIPAEEIFRALQEQTDPVKKLREDVSSLEWQKAIHSTDARKVSELNTEQSKLKEELLGYPAGKFERIKDQFIRSQILKLFLCYYKTTNIKQDESSYDIFINNGELLFNEIEKSSLDSFEDKKTIFDLISQDQKLLHEFFDLTPKTATSYLKKIVDKLEIEKFNYLDARILLLPNSNYSDYKNIIKTLNGLSLTHQKLIYERLGHTDSKARVASNLNILCSQIEDQALWSEKIIDFTFDLLQNEDFSILAENEEFKSATSLGRLILIKNNASDYSSLDNEATKILKQLFKGLNEEEHFWLLSEHQWTSEELQKISIYFNLNPEFDFSEMTTGQQRLDFILEEISEVSENVFNEKLSQFQPLESASSKTILSNSPGSESFPEQKAMSIVSWNELSLAYPPSDEELKTKGDEIGFSKNRLRQEYEQLLPRIESEEDWKVFQKSINDFHQELENSKLSNNKSFNDFIKQHQIRLKEQFSEDKAMKILEIKQSLKLQELEEPLCCMAADAYIKRLDGKITTCELRRLLRTCYFKSTQQNPTLYSSLKSIAMQCEENIKPYEWQPQLIFDKETGEQAKDFKILLDRLESFFPEESYQDPKEPVVVTHHEEIERLCQDLMKIGCQLMDRLHEDLSKGSRHFDHPNLKDLKRVKLLTKQIGAGNREPRSTPYYYRAYFYLPIAYRKIAALNASTQPSNPNLSHLKNWRDLFFDSTTWQGKAREDFNARCQKIFRLVDREELMQIDNRFVLASKLDTQQKKLLLSTVETPT